MRWTLWWALSPSQCLAGLAVLGAILLVLGRQRAGRALCIAGGGGLLLFGLLPLSHLLLEPLQSRFPQPRLPSRIDGILLMAGAELPSSTESRGEPQLSEHATRYTAALRLAARYPQARLVFVGGPMRDPSTGRLGQAGVARELLTTVGLDPRRLAFELEATDTCDSATGARRLLQPRADERWVVVTSAGHLPRTMACFRAAGWEVIPKPADYQTSFGRPSASDFRFARNLYLLDLALHEWVGLAYYRVSGRTRELFPAPQPMADPGGR